MCSKVTHTHNLKVDGKTKYIFKADFNRKHAKNTFCEIIMILFCKRLQGNVKLDALTCPWKLKKKARREKLAEDRKW